MNIRPFFWPASALVEAESGQDTASYMLLKLRNSIPLFINLRKWTGSLLTLGLLEVKGVCLTEQCLVFNVSSQTEYVLLKYCIYEIN